MIAGQKPESLEALAQGEADTDVAGDAAPSEEQMIEMASYRQQPQSDHRHHGDAAGCLGHHESHPLDDPLKSPGGSRICRQISVLAEVERTDRVFAERIFHELVMAGRAKIEPEAFVERVASSSESRASSR